MNMTEKQFLGIIRLSLAQMEHALRKSPDNEALKQLISVFQMMSEEENDCTL